MCKYFSRVMGERWEVVSMISVVKLQTLWKRSLVVKKDFVIEKCLTKKCLMGVKFIFMAINN